MVPRTQYTTADGFSIAYQDYGDGEKTLVLVPGFISNIELFWEHPLPARFFEGLGKFARVLLFDKRGTGLSDRSVGHSTLEERMSDVQAVMDAAGVDSASLVGYSEGGPMCCLFAATYPDRTDSLTVIGSYATRAAAEDSPWGRSQEEHDQMQKLDNEKWGGAVWLDKRAPSMVGDMAFENWFARFVRMSATPAVSTALREMNREIDVRKILPTIAVPTLVLHAVRDASVPVQLGRYLAENIPGAKFVELQTADHVPFLECSDEILQHVEEHITGVAPAVLHERVLKTVLFTDIVDSTRLASELGDQKWRDLLAMHHLTVRNLIKRFKGLEVKTTGDGFHIAFDGPARAIEFGRKVRDDLTAKGISVRIGLHTGECALVDGDIEGIAVHIAARVAGEAGSGEVYVSRTVKDLVAGAGFEFQSQGIKQLKGVEDEWELFAVG